MASLIHEARESSGTPPDPERAALAALDRAAIIEFLKTLQILTPGSPLVMEEK